ncbi:transcriptional regulator [Salipiger pallidus]|uniref:Transcriptional regulator n=1 Tax=Salipiger pallidus TaxID=1775170 RepID=A0A8J2ZGR8_9RHOB|nr:GntR family transcriptional regulator [Salipiger pallidus]GGG60458.1 transcriptional regulator [Salipiger pallidus]
MQPSGAADTLAEQIAARLRREILRGTLPPGAQLRERDSAAAMGVSRTPMREAIRILAKDGLLVLRPARSPLVAAPTASEVRDQVIVLQSLEVLSAQLACDNATAEDLEALHALQGRILREIDDMDPLEAFELDMAFHLRVAQASHNAALAQTHGEYLARLWRARYLQARMDRNRARVTRDHGTILAALKARNREAAGQAVEAHLARMAQDIVAALDAEAAQGRAQPDKEEDIE